MKSVEGGAYNWQIVVKLSKDGPSWKTAETKAFQDAFVGVYNRMRNDPAVFKYPSVIKKGFCTDANGSSVLHLDETLLDRNIVEIIMQAYGVEKAATLESMAEVDEILDLYFADRNRGKAILVSFAHGEDV
jgi:hypothetical protein